MTYLPQEVIRKKRDGQELNSAEIKFIVNGITDGSLSDAQLGAFAMAVFQQGMTRSERVNLTLDMMHSGSRLQWQDLNLDGPVVDKHSTGGVGDKVSLMLARKPNSVVESVWFSSTPSCPHSSSSSRQPGIRGNFPRTH